jgi:hypothetical protein
VSPCGAPAGEAHGKSPQQINRSKNQVESRQQCVKEHAAYSILSSLREGRVKAFLHVELKPHSTI